MNDKQKPAAMGAQYRLTEEQAKGLAERMPKTGTLQVIDDEPLCMAKRIEELEGQLLVMAGLLRETLTYVDGPKWQSLIGDRKAHLFLGRIDAALSGKLLALPVLPVAPEGWKLVPVEPTREMMAAAMSAVTQPQDLLYSQSGWGMNEMAARTRYRAMLAAAPKLEAK